VYKGTLPSYPHGSDLDDHHHCTTGKPMLVCSNTASMLSETWLEPHFAVSGDHSLHFGVFPCGTEPFCAAARDDPSCPSVHPGLAAALCAAPLLTGKAAQLHSEAPAAGLSVCYMPEGPAAGQSVCCMPLAPAVGRSVCCACLWSGLPRACSHLMCLSALCCGAAYQQLGGPRPAG
jgi:hypothetical protein